MYSGDIMPLTGRPLIRRALRAAGVAAALLIPIALLSACAPVSARPSLALPAPGGWLGYLNQYRAAAWLPPVTENAALSAGARKHATYIVHNGVLRHGEDPYGAGYSPEGQAAARQSNLFNSSDGGDSDGVAIDTWMQSPFHAVGVLDPRLAQVGYGSYREENNRVEMGAALNVLAGIDPAAQPTYPIFWPGNGASLPLTLHWGGYPSPLDGCPGYTAPSGLPLIMQLGSGKITPVVSATSFTQNGKPLEHCVIDETTYTTADRTQQKLGRSILGARDAIVLIPRFPLTSGTTYTASLTVNGRAYTWSFGVGSTVQALHGKDYSGLLR